MNKILLSIMSVSFIILSSIFLLSLLTSESYRTDKICFENQNCIIVEVVSTPEDMAKGLMYRKSLDENRGMLFVFTEDGRHSFWMKNMNFPLDMIWISKNRTIVHIERDVPPCRSDPCLSYVPDKKALYVLEVNANFTLRNNISPGSVVLF